MRMPSHRETIAAAALVAFDLLVVLVLGVAPSFHTAALVIMAVQPFLSRGMLQIRAFVGACIHATMLVLTVAAASSGLDGDDA